jgi:hypothetical protein
VSIQTLVNAGFEPDSVIAAVAARDMTLLKHTGLLSVQLQDPTAEPPAPAELPPPKRNDPFLEIERLLLHRATADDPPERLALEA